jgi:hypothetical protein
LIYASNLNRDATWSGLGSDNITITGSRPCPAEFAEPPVVEATTPKDIDDDIPF